MEKVVALCAHAAEGADVLVVEGLVPEAGMVYSTRVNALMAKALDAELVLVGSTRGGSPDDVANSVAIAARAYGEADGERRVSCMLNRVTARSAVAGSTRAWTTPPSRRRSSSPTRRRYARRGCAPSGSSRR
jgi:phosphate acetyltransferase